MVPYDPNYSSFVLYKPRYFSKEALPNVFEKAGELAQVKGTYPGFKWMRAYFTPV